MLLLVSPGGLRKGALLGPRVDGPGFPAQSSKGRVCLCGPLNHARVKQEVAHFDWTGPEVLQ